MATSQRTDIVPAPPPGGRARPDSVPPGAAGATPVHRQDLPMRFPIRHGLRPRRRWWRKFMSPVWAGIAAPALALPLVAMILMDDGPAPSLVEQAILALPIPGDASDPGQSGRVEVAGASGASMPASTTLSLYNNSARAAASRLAQRPEPGNAVPHFAAVSYTLLHPESLAGEDLLIGDVAMVFSTPVPDLSWAIFSAFCRTDATGRATLADLPINPNVPAAIVNFLPASDYGRLCPRLG